MTENKATKNEWQQYLRVQEGGMYNMLDPRAREMTTLTKDQWVDIIKNYGKYMEEFGRK